MSQTTFIFLTWYTKNGIFHLQNRHGMFLLCSMLKWSSNETFFSFPNIVLCRFKWISVTLLSRFSHVRNALSTNASGSQVYSRIFCCLKQMNKPKGKEWTLYASLVSFSFTLSLDYPVMLSPFLHSLGNYTRRAIFPEMCKINQSSVDFHCKPLWSLWLDWFIGFVPPDLFLRGRG